MKARVLCPSMVCDQAEKETRETPDTAKHSFLEYIERFRQIIREQNKCFYFCLNLGLIGLSIYLFLVFRNAVFLICIFCFVFTCLGEPLMLPFVVSFCLLLFGGWRFDIGDLVITWRSRYSPDERT